MQRKKSIEWPIADEGLISALKGVIDNNRWSLSGYWTGQDSYNAKFEKEFAKKNKVSYCVTVSSGSTALICALEALGIGEGDQVIVPALSWVATATAVLQVNAEHVLVDVCEQNYCIDPEKIESAITDRTKAIIAVHLCGAMAQMDRIMEIANKYNLKVIEDNAQTHFSMWKDKYAGTIADIGTFSFQQGKILTCGEGGAVVTDDYELYKKIQQLRCDGRAYVEETAKKYGFMEIEALGEIHGTNYNLSEFQAAILLHNMEKIDEQNELRQKNVEYLVEKLSEIDGIKIVKPYENNSYRTYYGYIIPFDKSKFNNMNAKEVIERLSRKLNIGSFYIHPLYPAIHKSPLFCPWTNKRYLKDVAKTEEFWRNQSHPVAESANENVIFLLHSLLLSGTAFIDELIEELIKIQG